MNKLIVIATITAFLCMAIASAAVAIEDKAGTQVKPKPTTTVVPYDQKKQIVKQAEDYLNAITTLAADFTQVAPNGEVSTGKFFLSRPGKLRLQYNPPVPILIVVNGSLLAYYDYELDQLSHSSADEILASFLTRQNISFNSDFNIAKIERKAGVIRIHLIKKQQSELGEISMVFAEQPFSLRKFEVVDPQGQITTVSLNNAKQGLPLDKKLFIIKSTTSPRQK